MIVVASASANETDAVDAGKSMEERQSIGVRELEIVSNLVDVVGGSIGVRKHVVEDELLSMEESVGGEWLTMVERMLLDVIDVVDSVDIGALEKVEERELLCKDEWMVGAGKAEVMKSVGRELADVRESVVVTKSGETVNSAVRGSAVATRLVAEIVEVVS